MLECSNIFDSAFQLLALTLSQKAPIAALCVGVCCGLLGAFVVVMFSEDRNPLVIFVCAVIAGILGVTVVRAIVKSTRLKADAALGIVLASFFAFGVFWDSMDQQSGVKGFLYGDLATVSDGDLWLMLSSTFVVSCLVWLFLRPRLWE